MSDVPPFMATCQLCGGAFRFGPHIYNGKVVAAYKLTLCDSCYGGNWDGYAPHYEPILEAHWEEHGLSRPARNKQGWYPRGG